METEKTLKRQNAFLTNLFKTPAEKSELINLLLSISPFSELDKKEIENLLSIIHDRIYESNEYIFYQGDPSIAIYIVFEGEIELTSRNSENKKVTLSRYKKSDFFGEMAFIDDEKRFASAKAVRESKLLVIFKPDLDEFIEKFPKKGVKILKGICQIFAARLRKMNHDYIDLLFSNNSKEV